jgi:hypothetical protein
MPKLKGDAKAAYELAHGGDFLRNYEDSGDLRHGGRMISEEELMNARSATGTKSLKKRFFHQPMHDAESVFWVIVAYLLRACPVEDAEGVSDGWELGSHGSQGREDRTEAEIERKRNQLHEVVSARDEDGSEDCGNEVDGNEDEDEVEVEDGDGDGGEGEDENEDEDGDEDEDKDKEGDENQEVSADDIDEEDEVLAEATTDYKLDQIWKYLAEHTIEENAVDSRDGIFNIDLDQWQDALHPKLSFLAPMLVQLCTQVQPEYSHIVPKPQELHLHEAMQRILFTYIWNMKNSDPIPLDQRLRAVTIRRYDIQVRTVDPLSFGSKRSRHDDDGPAKNRKSEFLPHN